MRTKVAATVVLTLAATLILALVTRAQTSVAPQENPTYKPLEVLPQNTASQTLAQAQSTVELIIGAGDLLEVSVYGAADFAKQVRVADTGDISLPLIGAVHVAGLTIQQAEHLVEQRLSDGGFFTNPQVSVLEKEYATQGISVLGEVQKPGIYPLLGQHRLFDAVSAAGGLTPKAGNTIMVSRRNNPGEAQTVLLPPNQTFPPDINIPVFPGDTVVISKAGIVYVVGDVRMPGGFVMENSRMSVLQAIAMAQGTNVTAKLDKTMLIRKSTTGPEQTPIPLKNILAAKAPDIPLQADDVVFVPRSAGKAAARRTLDAIVQAATGAAIYRPY